MNVGQAALKRRALSVSIIWVGGVRNGEVDLAIICISMHIKSMQYNKVMEREYVDEEEEQSQDRNLGDTKEKFGQ